ncbi:EamA family transporter [Kribbella sp. NPDC050281]|uniref:EamA family transporter n=1 Tax=Kribbella sp. NPDC050281 TaxID=3155515 RepID=UPI0033C1AE8A
MRISTLATIDIGRSPRQASPHLPSHVGAALLMLTPVGALALGALVLGERPTPLQLLGCVLILAGSYFATSASDPAAPTSGLIRPGVRRSSG